MFNKKIINEIKTRFKLNKYTCKPTVNEYIDNSLNRLNIEIACLLTNYKEIYFTSKPVILNRLDSFLKPLITHVKRIDYTYYYLSKPSKTGEQIFMIPTYGREKRTILYRHKGTRKAFLLLLHEQEKNLNEFLNPGSWVEADNHYLMGSLLYYPAKDILFFYKVAGFKQHLIEMDRESSFAITQRKAFTSWPIALKQEFYSFLSAYWLKSNTYKLYKRDQKEATKWLQEKNLLTLKTIKLNIQNIEARISLFNVKTNKKLLIRKSSK